MSNEDKLVITAEAKREGFRQGRKEGARPWRITFALGAPLMAAALGFLLYVQDLRADSRNDDRYATREQLADLKREHEQSSAEIKQLLSELRFDIKEILKRK